MRATFRYLAVHDADMDHDPPAPAGIDTSVPSIARVYDYLLGGHTNYQVDRELAEGFLAEFPTVRSNALNNRAFMGRAVRYLAEECGIDQFLDVGSALPTARNVHQVAQHVNPKARVVYVDNDPVVLAYSRGLLDGDENTRYVQADGQDTQRVISEAWGLLAPDRPTALLLISVAHYFPGDPGKVIARYADALAPGSYLVIAHITSDDATEAMLERMGQVFGGGEFARPSTQIEAMFQGWPLVPPGLVDVQRWPAQVGEVSELRLLGGVARKP